jgi:hypothetical protein
MLPKCTESQTSNLTKYFKTVPINVPEEDKRINAECHWTIDTDLYVAAFIGTHFLTPVLHGATSRAVDHENE